MGAVELLVYADRLGGSVPALGALLDGPLRDFGGVHVLPFYVPFDGADAGFDPIDHTSVDPRLGTWNDLRALSAGGRGLTADLVVNHVSSSSHEFTDWLANGDASEHAGMFLRFDTVFPDGATEEQITGFYRPRPGLPFTPFQGADGSRYLVWTTFLPTQVDLNVRHPAARAYLRRVLRALAAGGVTTVRLDAVGYAVKSAENDSFMSPQTLDFARVITNLAHAEGLEVLVEVHAHHTQQIAIAQIADLVYDFALAPLLLHSLGTGTVDRLKTWFAVRPTNTITVLDTHDGIGIIDAGPAATARPEAPEPALERALAQMNRLMGTSPTPVPPDLPDLLSHDEMAAIFARAERLTGGHSRLASVVPAWASLPHQINATFFSVLGADPVSYLLARAVQFFLPGRPQIYYVGLFGGLDDTALFARTGTGRDVNRHTYSPAEIAQALTSEITRAQLALVRLRSTHPAFEGEFSWSSPNAATLELRWDAGAATAVLRVTTTVGAPSFQIVLADAAGRVVLSTVASVAAWHPAG
ncbi:sucrose phosphorylase [Cryobacterium frigoriphilum]|uniref:Sucrose phosphorylase n=1 Tax=Cryobacterium frigoriphilum TaxID=1259150 RepID=A0A4R9A5V8_9MICO|nr:alpha-amylase family glycosyl hydrolase [Cryobacterium frigoriphilum]TFD52745.1 sucrose phosphorylase [Cryobacterium frigoriphilum]